MNKLQESFDEFINEYFQYSEFGLNLLINKFDSVGIKLTKLQKANIKEQLQAHKSKISFEISDKQVRDSSYHSKEELYNALKSTIHEILKDLENFDIDGFMGSVIEDITSDLSRKRAEGLIEDSYRKISNDFHFPIHQLEYVYEYWGEPLSFFLMLIDLADETLISNYERTDPLIEDDIQRHVLMMIQAKSHVVMKEIFTLLCHGYPDGAEGRWRTLHELSVISTIISNSDIETAQRYIDYECVEVYKNVSYYVEFNGGQILQTDLKDMSNDYERVVNLYGRSFKNSYGWATKILEKNRPSFKDLEECADLHNVRTDYKLACSNIHAGPHGVYKRLGLNSDTNLILTGSSFIGIDEPAISAINSFVLILCNTITKNPNLDMLVTINSLTKYSSHVIELFTKAKKNVAHVDIDT